MYAARDVTSTVGCLGLITSSIISKKAAEGISSLVLDIKWGAGCYQASLAQAQEMAVALQQTSASLGLATTAVISHMQSPLGRAVGNSLEVGEALDCLHGRGARDLRELVCVEAGMVLVSAGRVDTLDRAKQTVEAVLDSGAALAKFETMLVCQGVEHGLAARLCHQDNHGGVLPAATQRTPLTVPAAGLVQTVDAAAVARLAIALGAGRAHPQDQLDLAAGVELQVEPGDLVQQGAVWAVVHHNREIPAGLLSAMQEAIVVVKAGQGKVLPRISEVRMAATQ